MKIISQIEKTGKSGKPFYAYSLDDGTQATGVDLLPLNTEIGETHEVVVNGNFRNLKSKGPMHPRPAGLKPNMEKLMGKKNASIDRFQDTKHKAIKMAGAMRDATLITLAELAGSPLVAEDFKSRWEHWRTFLLQKADEPF